ncbi:MAG: dihydrolipoamide acetyltransferase family protein [Acidimicrobiales bacterium]|nr:dihydrolipoamide acetyltransferase family protein [Acidimicrobiales bacterium]
MADITMPQLGETVTEGTITRWAKQVGDTIKEDEILFEVSTDKVDSEVPSPVSGVITAIVVPEGDTVPVGAVLATVGDAGEAPAPAAEAAPPVPAAEPAPAPAEEPATLPTPVAEAPAAPPAPPAPPAAPAPAAPPVPAPAPAPAASQNGGPANVLSPVVRKLLSENNLDPSIITGTGAGGRITRNDVLAALDQRAAGGTPATPASPADPQAPTPPATPPTPAAPSAPAPRAGERDTQVPFSNIRKRTAEHMVRSLSTSAHTLVVTEVDYENVEKVRSAHKAAFKAQEGASLTYLPFIARAVVDAIREFPHVNASVGDNELIVHNYVNLGIAVDLNFEGLIVPVVHDADTKRLRALAREVGDLANRAKSKKLGADDISGGTFTITNAGGYGTLITGPIINQPQVAILSTDGVKPQPVAVPLEGGGYAIAVHHVGNLAISFDHRAYDGAYAAAFLAKIREILETRDWATELT